MNHRTDREVRIAWTALALGAAIFLLSAIAVSAGLADATDSHLLLLLRDRGDLANALGPPWFEEAAAEITTLGGFPILILVAAVVVTSLLLLHKRDAALFLLMALLTGSALSTMLKRIFDRPRPDLVDHLDRTFTSSFPSAHAMISMLTWLTLAAVAARFIPRRALRRFMLVGAFALALVIGASRIYLGVHWPTDVLAGWAIGVAWAAGCWLLAHYLTRGRGHAADLGESDT
jgi:undecaprenyl-diphosphatase